MSNYPVTVQDIKDCLVGLGPWLNAAACLPPPYTYDDTKIETRIPAQIRDFERQARFRITEVQVSTKPDGTYPSISNRRLVTDDPYNYYVGDAPDYLRITLKQRPVLQVQRVRIMLNDQLLYEIPPSWLVVQRKAGVISLIPTTGNVVINSVSSAAIFALGISATAQDYIPSGVQIDYTAGLPHGWWRDEDDSDEWADLKLRLTEYCALAVLNDIAHLPDAGLRSVSVSGGGGGQTLNYTRFEDRKAELKATVDPFIQTLRDQETPFFLGFV